MPRPAAGRSRGVEETTPARHGERADWTYLQLRELIIRGDLAAGERVLEAEQAVRLGVSRTPVREALDRLEHEGFLVPAGVGLRTQLQVAPIVPEAVSELWSLVAAVESVAVARLDGMTRRERHALAADLFDINEQLKRAAARRSHAIAEVNRLLAAFHERLVQAGGGAHLIVAHQTLYPHIRRYDWALGRTPGASYAASIREHNAIIGAIMVGDVKRVQRLLERHWQAGLARTARGLRTP